MSKEFKLDVILDTDLMIRKLDAITKHAKALSDELKLIDSQCNCKHKGECYKTLGEHGYKVSNCKGLVE